MQRTDRLQAGFSSLEALVGAVLALVAVAASLALVRGLQRLAVYSARDAERAAAAAWALDRAVREVERAGLGVCPGREPSCPDEAIELFDEGVLAVRGDLDRDDPSLALAPETALAGEFARVDTGNDEVVVFLRRSRGRARARFEADLDGSARVSVSPGIAVAPRDGAVEPIDAGPADGPGDGERGTLYRVTFVNDARYLGTSRFRVVEPLADDVLDFRVRAWDAGGRPIAACGGGDDPTSRTCRAAIRRIALELVTGGVGRAPKTFRREVALEEPW